MKTEASPSTKVVVVHRGARDSYQVARGLAEAGLLETLVTDLYWPGNRAWAQTIASLLPPSLRALLHARYAPGLPSSAVSQCWPWGPYSFLLEKVRGTSFARRQNAQRKTDAALGRMAGARAEQTGAKLLSYSYYGYHAFSRYCRTGMLFQVHPHPVSVRRILLEELAAHPECRNSLEKEWELALPEEDFERLSAEADMADKLLCASSFTRRTLVENGASPALIDVIPYGVDSNVYRPAPRPSGSGPFRLLFVGTINQRKGIKYLLQALKQLGSAAVELTVCGRVVDDLRIFQGFGPNVQVRASVSFPELLRAYQEADLFVFPSVVEGFAQVLLEAMACGLPILSTTHTAAPDLIEDGIQGFVVEPRRPDLLADRIEWAATHRHEMQEMRVAARRRAEHFTWARFREGVVRSVQSYEPRELEQREVLSNYA